MNYHLGIYGEYECITKRPVLTGKATTHIQVEHNASLHIKEKGQKEKKVLKVW